METMTVPTIDPTLSISLVLNYVRWIIALLLYVVRQKGRKVRNYFLPPFYFFKQYFNHYY